MELFQQVLTILLFVVGVVVCWALDFLTFGDGDVDDLFQIIREKQQKQKVKSRVGNVDQFLRSQPSSGYSTCLSRLFVYCPRYNPFRMSYPEYKRWKDYCVKVDTFIEYAQFRQLCIFPECIKPNPLDEFLD